MSTVDFSRTVTEQRKVAGKIITVAVTPRLQPQGHFTQIPHVAKSLWSGMKLTLGYFVRPWKVVTRQYPENRATLKFPERYRANLYLVQDEEGIYLCNGCRSCERACPNGSIIVKTRKGEVSGKHELDYYVWRQDSCTFCNLCVLACPTEAVKMGHEFESAVYDRRLLIRTLNGHAGPSPELYAKLDEETRRRVVLEPRGPYEGPVPLAGEAYPNILPIRLAEEPVAKEGSA